MIFITSCIAKTISILSKVFHIGAGFVWPGHLVLELFPSVLSPTLFNFPKGVVLISGTNGKTTTSKLVAHVLKKHGLSVCHNESGANLVNGLVTAILLDRDFLGRTRSDIGVFEVDEFALANILNYVSPKVLALLNLSRDQLDRYGETDIVLNKWQEALLKMSKNTVLIVDGSQEDLVGLANSFKGVVGKFDSSPDVLKYTALRGGFNSKNVHAAIYISSVFGISKEACLESLRTFEVAYGRGESVEYAGKHFPILLAKNPSSFNRNLEAFSGSKLEKKIESDAVLVVLNDNIPDGRDVSWIYDIKPNYLREAFAGKTVLVSGTRCYDMAIRLQYAGVLINETHIFSNLKNAFSYIVDSTDFKEIVVLPNYSAMLEVRKILLGRSVL